MCALSATLQRHPQSHLTLWMSNAGNFVAPDPHEADAIGKLRLSSAGLKRRNKLVFETAAKHGSRLVVTLGGGYPKDLNEASEPFHRVVQAHLDVYRQCATIHART